MHHTTHIHTHTYTQHIYIHTYIYTHTHIARERKLRDQITNPNQNSRVRDMSVDNTFSSKMYHNEQWRTTHSVNVISTKML